MGFYPAHSPPPAPPAESMDISFNSTQTSALADCEAFGLFADCVGGGCLSVATVSGTAMLVRALVQPLQEAQEADKPAK